MVIVLSRASHNRLRSVLTNGERQTGAKVTGRTRMQKKIGWTSNSILIFSFFSSGLGVIYFNGVHGWRVVSFSVV